MRTERELLVDCLERLNQVGVPYMLVGSMASNYWGIPRSTHDLDFVVALQPTSVDSLAAAFGNGFFIQIESIRRAFAPPHQFNAIDEQSALKVDFWLLTQNVFERMAFERRRRVELFGVAASIMSAEDVILHKFYWHSISPSDRQLLDAAGVYAVQRENLDRDYLQTWAAHLGVEAELSSLMSGRLKPKSA